MAAAAEMIRGPGPGVFNLPMLLYDAIGRSVDPSRPCCMCHSLARKTHERFESDAVRLVEQHARHFPSSHDNC